MKVALHPYEMEWATPQGSPISVKGGWLLRIEFSSSLIGYADFHPLAADQSLAERALSQGLAGEGGAQWKQSLKWAEKDAQARKDGRSLFEGLSLPLSHYTLPYLGKSFGDEVQEALDQGFTRIKVKVGRNKESEIKRLNESEELLTQDFKLRLDFNAQLKKEDWLFWQKQLRSEWVKKLEFVEDPLPWDEELWAQSPWVLANDFERPPEGSQAWAAVVVSKPALGEMSLPSSSRQVYTHIMDHPLGQLGAIWTAASVKSNEVGGFFSPYLRDTQGFSEKVNFEGPRFRPSPDVGWGFSDLLRGLQWENC